MKTIVWAASLGTTLVTAFGQCESEFSPHNGWQNVSIETSGSITYLKISYQTSCPWTLGKQPAVVQGTNVMQRLFMFADPLVACPFIFPQPAYTKHATVLLGKFDPGDYVLQLQMSGLISSLPFTVSNPQPTLSLVSADSRKLTLQINGTSNTTYRLESSSTLTNWMTVAVFAGGPAAFTNAPASATFYRVLISDGLRICP